MLDVPPFALGLARDAGQPPPVDPAAFRATLRELVGAVSVVTVGRGSDLRNGFTATSVTSLSADPPLLLVCVNRSTSSYPQLLRDRAFAVNVLNASQRDISDRFAGREGASGDARFRGARWTTLVTGAPVLAEALAAADCDVEEVIERGTHAIVIGAVRAVRAASSGAALAYWRGGYEQIGWSSEDAALAAGLAPY